MAPHPVLTSHNSSDHLTQLPPFPPLTDLPSFDGHGAGSRARHLPRATLTGQGALGPQTCRIAKARRRPRRDGEVLGISGKVMGESLEDDWINTHDIP